MTPNGKLDRKALPEPDNSALAVQAYEAPQGAIEQQLAEVWQALLGLERVGRHDNFFALGGHSLIAVQLVFRLQQISGWEVTLRQLFNCPTICQLAGSMSEDMANEQHPNLMVVRNLGEKRPLFLIHPAGGEVAYAYQLAPWISDVEMPIYGIAATIPLEGKLPDYSVQKMARDYIEGLRTVQPKGPYRLAGWSLGGSIAYEMAYQLMGEDEKVEFLGLLDTASDYQPQAPDERVSEQFDGVSWLLMLLPEELSDHERLSVEQLAEEGSFETVLAYIQTHHLVPILPSHLPAEFVLRHLEVHHKMVVASEAYHYSPLPVKLTLFSAIEGKRGDISLGWQGRIPEAQLDIIPVSGNHQTMVELPNVKVLGRAMQDRLIALEEDAMDYPEQHYNPLISIQQGRPGVTPLFCVPGAAASVFDFYPLVQTLPPEIPVYGLQARGLDSELVPHSDVTCAAKAYLEAIRNVYPQGPYCLLGHSFGGWIAFEMALLLQQEGETVSQLIVVDSRVPHCETCQVPLLGHIEILMKLVSIYNRRLDQPLPLSASDFVGLTSNQQREVLYQALVNVGLLPAKSSPTLLDGIIRVFTANMAARYVPHGSYQGKLVLINAEDEGISEDSLTGWQALARDIEHRIIPGNHMSMLELPSVREMGELLEYSFIRD